MKRAISLLLAILLVTSVAGCEKAKGPEATETPQALSLEIFEPEDGIVVEAQKLTVSGKTTPRAVISINGEVAEVDSDGSFSVEIALEEGLNNLEIIASDGEGSEVREMRGVFYMP